MKKGFTLVELLTIIVVLGIIALIAVPTIINIVDTAKKESFEKSVRNVVKAIEYKCHEEKIDRVNPTKTYTFTEDGVEPEVNVKGKLPTEGTITVNGKCETVVDVSNGKYVVNNIPEATDESCFETEPLVEYELNITNETVETCKNVIQSNMDGFWMFSTIISEGEYSLNNDNLEDYCRNNWGNIVEDLYVYEKYASIIMNMSSPPPITFTKSSIITSLGSYVTKHVYDDKKMITGYKCGNTFDLSKEGYDEDGEIVDVIIPSTIDNKPVTKIADFAFGVAEDIVYFDVINSLLDIYGELTQETIETLGEDYVMSLSNPKIGINSVLIPDTVTSIGIGAFANNTLKNIILSKQLTEIKRLTFANNQLASIIIPDSVTSIGIYAFPNNQLTSVIIPRNITSIGSGAFSNNNLTSVTIPKSITSISNRLFANNELTSVTIPRNIISIGSGAFGGNQLTSVTIPNSVTSIGALAFAYNKLATATIPNSVTTIGNEAFANNELRSVIIGNGVTSIGEDAFKINYIPNFISNPHLLTINNNTGRVFDWYDITRNGYSCTFATGTCGQVTIN